MYNLLVLSGTDRTSIIMTLLHKFFTTIVFLGFITSCSNSPANKSVLEKLTTDEIEELTKEKNEWLAMTLVISQRIVVEELPIDKKDQLKKLTYKQLNDFLKLFSKKDEALEKKYGQEWDNQFGTKLEEMKKIAQRKKNEAEEKLSSTFLKVEWIGIEGDASSNWVDIKLKLTPLKGKIDETLISCGITCKDGEINWYYYDNMERNRLNVKNPFSSPIEIVIPVHYNSTDVSQEDFTNLSPKQMQDKYHFETHVENLKQNGKIYHEWISNDDASYYLRSLWDAISSGDEEKTEYYLILAAEEEYGITIIKKEQYINEAVRHYHHEKYPAAAWLVYNYTFKMN